MENMEQKNEKNIGEDDEDKVDSNEYYDWEMIPRVNSENSKTGVTFNSIKQKITLNAPLRSKVCAETL